MGEAAYFGNHEGSYYYDMTSLWDKVKVIKRSDLMSFIDRFSAETPHGKYPCTKKNVLYLIRFVFLDQITKIKICRMVASENPEVIEGRRQMIAMCVLYSEE